MSSIDKISELLYQLNRNVIKMTAITAMNNQNMSSRGANHLLEECDVQLARIKEIYERN